MYPHAITEFEKYLDLSGRDVDAVMRLGCACADSGDEQKGRELLDELKALSHQRYVSPGAVAALEVALGEYEQAIASLNAGVDQHATAMLMLAADPVFDPLRSDLRFHALLPRIGLPLEAGPSP
jgi:Flp pilus assembly protein TadD